MKINLEIKIKKVNNFTINKELTEKSPNIISSMEKFTKDLISHLKGFYTKNKIDVNIKYKIIQDE